MQTDNERIVFAKRPEGWPTAETFRLEKTSLPDLKDDDVLLKTLFISVDPYMRGRMNTARSYVAPFAVGEPLTGGIVAEVVESRYPHLNGGDVVVADLPWQRYNAVAGNRVRKVDANTVPPGAYLSILGLTGLTAYFGLMDIGRPKAGETVVVSGAAGAVGSTVGQIAKIAGCRVVGIAGTADKVRYLVDELGFDAAVNYKSPGFQNELKAACPDGVDIYFDNVGGSVTDLVILLLNDFARIPLCGQISLYNAEQIELGPRVFPILLTRRALLKGFIVSDYAARFGEAVPQLAEWLKVGKLKYSETVLEGFDQVPQAFLGLFRGENIGKQLVRVAAPKPKRW